MAQEKQIQSSAESEPEKIRGILQAQSDFDGAMEKLEQELWGINDELIGELKVGTVETEIGLEKTGEKKEPGEAVR